MNEVKTIAQNKFPLRKIESYAEATREALIEFIKRNQKYKNKLKNSQEQLKTDVEV